MPKIAAIQMSSSNQIERNLEAAHHLIEQAVKKGAELVVLPENFALLASEYQLAASRMEMTAKGPIRSFAASQARHHGIWVIAGSIPVGITNTSSSADSISKPDRVSAACFVYDSLGQQVARYDKIHLFDVDVGDAYGRYRESDTIAPGNKVVTVDTPVGRIGLSVCYDLRFPEIFRLLADQGAEVITVPSAFTATTGAAHWQSLLRARAIENICYVVAPNQTGKHAKARESYGHTMVVDPWGEVVDELPGGEGIVLADVDLTYLHDLRQRMPVQQHRYFKHIK